MKSSASILAISGAFFVVVLMACAIGILFADTPHPMHAVAEQAPASE